MTDEVAPPADAGQGMAEAVKTINEGPWYSGIENPELRGYIETKGFKSPEAVAESYRNLEKLRGVPAERLVTLPEDVTAEGALDPVWSKLGRPETPDAYTNAIGEALADDAYKAAAAQAHKLGLSDKQFEGMQGWLKETTASLEAKRAEQVDGAFTDWQEQNPQALKNAQRMLGAVGVDAATLDAALQGDKAKLFDVLGKIAGRMGEGRVPESEGDASLMMSPEAAKARISQKLGDKDWSAGYFSTNPKIRAPFMAEMERLQKIASGAKA